jgi:hypothetical protein
VAGPEICDHIDVDTQIEIAVPALGVRETLFWPYVAPSARVQGGATMGGLAQPPVKKQAPPAPAPGPERAAEPAVEQKDASPGPEDDTGPKKEEPEEAEKDTTSADPDKDSDKDKGDGEVSRFRALYAVIPLLLIAAGAGAYFLWPREPVTNGTTTTDTPQPSGGDAPIQRTDTPPAADTREARDRLRDMNKENASADAFYEYGLKLIQAQKWEDGFLAMDIAGQKGHPKALFQLGRWYDPKTFDTKMGFSKPNPVSAAEYYRKAQAKGLPEAKAALDEVCKVLSNKETLPSEQAAVAADAQARFCTP